MTVKIGAIVGSISSTSINRALFNALVTLAPSAGVELTEIPIKELPFYTSDFDGDYPEVATDFKHAIEDADGIVIITPEYNRSVPGVLKNALDVASRPWGQNSFAGKPSAVIGASAGQIGTAVAQQHLRSVLSFFGSPELAQPEAYIWSKPGLITADGEVTDEATARFLTDWLTAVAAHVNRHSA
ncbi:NADPH-dependent FMN reductase [Mycetocola reblochoni]|uniref:NADPH:quinone oxidoreductase n=2 Tax=Mycetocola reblochoni TaxID=331618 RepID=A0A1R4KC23_9MICO|nr:NADPH-dependent FMN reductase [Mycetocola reblochoni]RLP68560.1 NAD(P)H-dependent oxidoreductase [Mycetocola reblochoni]SJN41788.1 NADPH:quinone oxidoreductase [Mycetocola reblochoni REB411]